MDQTVKVNYKPCLQAGRWILEMDEGPCHPLGQRFLRFVICDLLQTQTTRTLSHPYRDTSEKLGTWNTINVVLRGSLTVTHVTNAMSGILTTFPFSTCSSYSSQAIFSSAEVANRSDGRTFSDLFVCLMDGGFSSSSSSRSLSERYP